MLASLVLLALSPARFDGGDARELAKKLFETTKQPVAIAVSERATFPAFDFDPADTSSFARIVKTSTKLSQSPGVQLAFSDVLPRSLIEVDPIHRGSQGAPLNGYDMGKSVSNGMVTIETPANSGLTATSLMSAPFSKPVRIQWMMEKMSIPVFASQMPERDFLNLIAKATAMRLVVQPKGYEFEIDPGEFRKRAMDTFKTYATPEATKSLNDSRKQTLDMAQYAISVASNDHIKTAFALPGSSAMIVLSGSSKQQVYAKIGGFVRTAASNPTPQTLQIEQRRNRESNESEIALSGGSSVQSFFRSVDWNNDVGIVLMSNFTVRVVGFTPSRGNRPGREISVNFGRNQGN